MVGCWFPEVIIAQNRHGIPLPLKERPLTKSLVSGEVITATTTYVCKDGSLLPVSITVSPIILEGKPIGAIEVFRDISHEQEVDRMKTEFIYLASHQLRTPLSAVKTYAHMLAEGYRGDLNAGQTAFMQIIMSSLDRMNEIINTLLNISRIESGVMAITPASVTLREIVEQSLAELEPAMAAKQITIRKSFAKAPPVTTDQLLVREVCLNLLSNAIKYTPDHGTVSVSIRVRKDDQVLGVKDTGYGIPVEAQAQIFAKFYRAPNILEQVGEGTGLGLYLVKGIADVLHGKVWFKSQEHHGSTFYFSLPCAQDTKSPK
jgi:signal transduction histidine kinase